MKNKETFFQEYFRVSREIFYDSLIELWKHDMPWKEFHTFITFIYFPFHIIVIPWFMLLGRYYERTDKKLDKDYLKKA